MWKNFFKTVMGTSIVLFSITILFNILVDPYDIWGNPRYRGVNLCAVRSEDRERLFKPIHVISDKPDALFLGNSKCDFSIDPEIFARLTGIPNTYNMSVRNGQPHELRKYLELAIKNNPRLKAVLLEVDYEMFLVEASVMNGFDAKQANRTHLTRDNAFKTTLSADACIDSLITLQRNREFQYDYPTYERNGKLSEGSLFSIFSYEASFYKNTRGSIIAQYWDNLRHNPEISDEKFREISRIVALCKEHQIDLKVFSPPVHAIHLDSYDTYWSRYAAWETRLANIVPFMDFSLYNEITTINPELPLRDNPYFWDSAHIKSHVGNIILTCLYDPSAEAAPKDFARQVTSENVAGHLAFVKRQHATWVSQNERLKKDLSSVGRFVPECPPKLRGNLFPAKDSFVLLPHLPDSIEIQKNQALHFDGILLLPPPQIQTPYAILEDASGKRFYAMANRQGKNDRSELSALFQSNDATLPYDFMTGAILESVPPGKYHLRIAVLLDNGTVRLSPFLREIIISNPLKPQPSNPR